LQLVSKFRINRFHFLCHKFKFYFTNLLWEKTVTFSSFEAYQTFYCDLKLKVLVYKHNTYPFMLLQPFPFKLQLIMIQTTKRLFEHRYTQFSNQRNFEIRSTWNRNVWNLLQNWFLHPYDEKFFRIFYRYTKITITTTIFGANRFYFRFIRYFSS
jgi:hypothetical protein